MLASLAAGAGTVSAQVILDGTLGPAGALSGPNYEIPAEAGALRGNNLFHSFSQLNLVQGDVARFTGPASVQNVLARVTGGSPSSIDGTIRSEIAGANLFLINPSGIIFGPHATLDVTGSFAASTADYLKMADGARFVAALDADDSVLQSAPVTAFGFLTSEPAPLQLDQGTLEVGAGKSVALSGGHLGVDGGSVKAPGGTVNLASVRSPGEVPADLGGTSRETFKGAFPAQGEIALRNAAKIDGSGPGGGRVVIRGGRLTVENSKIEANTLGAKAGQGIDVAVAGEVALLNGGQINSLTPAGLARGGDIKIAAETVRLDGGGALDEFFNPTTQISAATGELFFGGGPAKGGDVVIRADHVDLFNAAQISSATAGEGDAGRIDIEAKSLRLDAQIFNPTQITANTQQNFGGGNAGDVAIRVGTFDLLNGATILAASFGSGQAGRIVVEAQNANLLSGAVITAGTFGPGPGGNVQLTADKIRIDGRDLLTGGPDFLTGIQAITTGQQSPAPGGTIQVRSSSLEMVNNASIFTSSFGQGPGGNVEVLTGNLTLAAGSTLRATGAAAGAAGNISVQARQSVVLEGQSGISTFAPGSSGGDIDVQAGGELRLQSSEISAQAGLDGGNISLGAGSLLYLLDSKITGQADSTGTGFGNGGNLTLRPPILVLNDGELISKSSFGNGGNILILSDYFFPSASLIDASAPFGLPGTVEVTAPDVDLTAVLAVLPANFVDASTLLRPDCGVRLTGNISSFIVMGRGGVPLVPGGFVPSAPIFSHERR